uniref:Cell division protein SepF n=1 Tax=uncultured marine group II/III euryarchaeote KM3_27_D02 TaxID=1456428 RepID=A0A075H0T4_9EURY|nr:hypothetical protein [uncultured marine group II/III euryarchaeote KM3_27_D02]
MSGDDETGPRWLDVPSIEDNPLPSVDPGDSYHDLGALYSDAPVPRGAGDIVIRRAVLHDVTGLEEILNWTADGELVILELQSMLDRGFEFETAVEQITSFVEGDLGGSLVQLGDQRILILPAGFRGVSGLEDEPFEAS